MSNKTTVTAKPGEQNILIERVFDAPLNKVYEAMSQKEKLEKWWVGPGQNMRVDHLDLRDGGSWRFVQTAPDGQEFAFFGCYHEVSPERTIMTFEFGGLPERGHTCLEKMELTQTENNKTKLTATITFMNVADRDGMVQSG